VVLVRGRGFASEERGVREERLVGALLLASGVREERLVGALLLASGGRGEGGRMMVGGAEAGLVCYPRQS